QELLREGVTVSLTDRDPERLARAADALDVSEGWVLHHAADVGRLEEIEALGTVVQEEVGDVDILVHAAGVTGAQGLFHEIDDDGWVDTHRPDLLGAVRITRQFLPALRRGGVGSPGVPHLRGRRPALGRRASLLRLQGRASRAVQGP